MMMMILGVLHPRGHRLFQTDCASAAAGAARVARLAG